MAIILESVFLFNGSMCSNYCTIIKSNMHEMCRRLIKLSYVVQSDKEGKTRHIGFRDKVRHV